MKDTAPDVVPPVANWSEAVICCTDDVKYRFVLVQRSRVTGYFEVAFLHLSLRQVTLKGVTGEDVEKSLFKSLQNYAIEDNRHPTLTWELVLRKVREWRSRCKSDSLKRELRSYR
jgi:hypothetical protein